MHFTRMGGYDAADVPIIVRGDGCYLEDANGKRYLDALAGLFSVNIGYSLRRGDRAGGARADARAALLHELVVRAPARDRARRGGRLAGARATSTACSSSRVARRRSSRRGSSRASTTSRGARSGSARCSPSRRRYHDALVAAAQPRPRRYKAIARHVAYHGTTMGALSINGIPAIRDAVRAARARGAARPQHEPLPPADRGDRGGVHRIPARRPRADDPRHGPRDGLPRAHGAGAERRRRASRRPPATGRACARSATATTSCSPPTR